MRWHRMVLCGETWDGGPNMANSLKSALHAINSIHAVRFFRYLFGVWPLFGLSMTFV